MRRARVIAWLIGLAGVAGFLVGVAQDHYLLRMASKPLPVLAMAAVALASGHRYGRTIAAGLAACVVGDVLLETSDATFLAGVFAFLVGHLFYTAAFVGRERALRPACALPFAAWGAAVVVFLRPGLDSQGMTVPVAVYTLVICVMMWRATARLVPGTKPAADVIAAFLGAVSFATSDTMIAIDRFGQSWTGARYWIIVLYWLGQLGITYSAMTRTPS